MATDYKGFCVENAPPWLRDPTAGIAFLRALGDVKDARVARAYQALLARFPMYAPPDALARIGAERQLLRSSNDTDEEYARRLLGAWDLWPWAGTPFGLLTALAQIGYAAEIRIQSAMRYYLDANGDLVWERRASGEWYIDNDAAFWSRFVVLLTAGVAGSYSAVVIDTGVHPAPTPSGLSTFIGTVKLKITGTGLTDNGAFFQYSLDGGGSWSAGQAVTSAPSQLGATGIFLAWPPAQFYNTTDTFHFDANGLLDDSIRVASIIKKWKSSHSTCTDIFIITSGRTWDSYPTGSTWDAQGRTTWDSDLATPTRWSP